MKRLRSFASWRKIAISTGVLLGLSVGMVGSEYSATAGPDCPGGGDCDFKKPNFMIIMDYSSSMNQDFDQNQTRWEASVTAVQSLVGFNNGFFHKNMHLALMRFGHDPDPQNSGTTIQNDTSGIVDGQSLDVAWFDDDLPDDDYHECNGDAIIDSLDATPAPLCQGDNCSGIGTWTKGSLDFTQAIVADTRAKHPEDLEPMKERFYAAMVMTDGLWTSPNGLQQGAPASENPAITAADLFTNEDVPTYVVAFGDAMGEAFADELASAGGTMQAYEAANPAQLEDALEDVVTDIEEKHIIPTCTEGLPRLMVILDASSSMLNVGGQAGMMDETGWDKARAALAGASSIFDIEVTNIERPVEDLVHLGLVVFGHNNPPEENILVNYGPCMKDNFDWALDPWTSCEMPGCDNPWGGPTIQWTFKDGQNGEPFFDAPTFSHMPQCGGGGPICSGSGTYLHRGLELADQNVAAYQQNPPDLYPIDASTQFANILITDGSYTGYSNDSQVSSALIEMHQNDGILTYVIGFGDMINVPQLANMACWGSGGSGNPCNGGTVQHFNAANQQDLEDALKTIIEGINFDPCCAFNDCSFNPEPTTGQPDPEMTTGETDTDTDSDTESSTTSVDTTESATDTDGTSTSSGEESGEESGSAETTSAVTTESPTTDTGSESTGPDEDVTGGDSCNCSADQRGSLAWVLPLLGLGLVWRRRRVT